MSIRRYSPSQTVLHWLNAVTVLLIVALPYGADFFAGLLDGKGNIFALHKSLGVAVLLLTLTCLTLRRVQGVPDTLEGNPDWQHAAAKAGYFLLYAVLIVIPLPGMLAGKRSLDLFWLVQIGPLDLPKAFKAFAGGTYVTVQYLLFVLTLDHAAAAIWHHRVQRDNVLRAMLPQRGVWSRRRTGMRMPVPTCPGPWPRSSFSLRPPSPRPAMFPILRPLLHAAALAYALPALVADPQPTNGGWAQSDPTPIGYAVLDVSCEQVESGTACDVGLYVRDELVGNLQPGASLTLNLQPGVVDVYLAPNGPGDACRNGMTILAGQTLTLHAGETHNLRIALSAGGLYLAPVADGY